MQARGAGTGAGRRRSFGRLLGDDAPGPECVGGCAMTLLKVTDLVVEFKDADSGGVNRACNELSLDVGEGEIVGLVGESGCGKSTLGRAIVGLEHPQSGSIMFDGVDVLSLPAGRQREARRRLQYIFQDPLAALEPRQT